MTEKKSSHLLYCIKRVIHSLSCLFFSAKCVTKCHFYFLYYFLFIVYLRLLHLCFYLTSKDKCSSSENIYVKYTYIHYIIYIYTLKYYP